jgi:protocatechuate 3,4-dioxygenase beta subunit
VIALFVSVAILSFAQQTPPQTVAVSQPVAPARDTVPGEKKSTAVIRGKITNAEGRPLRRVQVRLSGESVPDGRTASTNGLGQYELRDLPAGRYSLSANRAGYLNLQYGQAKPGEPGRTIELAEDQTIDKLDLVLIHTAIISGHVLDEVGDPLAGANVMAMQLRFFNGKKRLLPVRGNFITDDTGQYRISGLDPGDYYVQASSRETWETDPPDKQMLGFVPTYYPSNPNPTEAQRVRVKAAQEAAGTDVQLLTGKVTRISGTVTNAQGQPLAGESVNLGYEIRGENFSSFFGGQSTKSNRDGTFQFRNIAPGDYHVRVRTAGTADSPVEAANVVVSTIAGDVEGLNVVTSGSGTISGRVVLEGDRPFPTPLTKLVVNALPVDRDTTINGSISTIVTGPDNGRLQEDGSFALRGVVGSNRLSIGPLSENWTIQRIEYNGHDYTTLPLDPQGQTLDGALIVLTNRFPVVSGVLRDDKGNPATTGIAVLFPEDVSFWAEDLRNIRVGRANDSGTFTMRAVRPGEYLAIAVPSIQNNTWNDPEFLETMRPYAKRLTVKEGETAQIDLSIHVPDGGS